MKKRTNPGKMPDSFDINLYDINLYDINLYDINLYDINLYDINLSLCAIPNFS